MASYTLKQFCEDKFLPLDYVVETFGVRDGEDTLHYKSDNPTGRWKAGDPYKVNGVFFPYTTGDGTKQHRIRHSKSGKRFCWGSDYKHQMLYGLNSTLTGDGKTVGASSSSSTAAGYGMARPLPRRMRTGWRASYNRLFPGSW
jgi:hypothetical protein